MLKVISLRLNLIAVRKYPREGTNLASRSRLDVKDEESVSPATTTTTTAAPASGFMSPVLKFVHGSAEWVLDATTTDGTINEMEPVHASFEPVEALV